ncbi:MAG: hypothetical protein HY788_16930 [Deltaproteobacteria bacterium]|nr:hypothetical protein [Deltaproteobacteria bacterium]
MFRPDGSPIPSPRKLDCPLKIETRKINPVPRFTLVGVVEAQGGDGAPPFVQGEVAVYAALDQLAGFVIGKFLPNAGISMVSL